MQINRNSWHYKFWKFTRHSTDPDRTNLCRYVQRIFWHGLIFSWLAAMMAVVLGYMLYAIFFLGFYHHPGFAFSITGAIAVACGLAFLLYRWKQGRAYHEPGIVGQWIAAKKEGVCPTIEFTDGQE